MPSAGPQEDNNRPRELALVESVWQGVRAHLEGEHQRVYEEIKSYPRPIPGCDLQFNHLLAERASLSEELDRIDATTTASLPCGDARTLLEEFLRSSRHLDEGAKRRFLSALQGGRCEAL